MCVPKHYTFVFVTIIEFLLTVDKLKYINKSINTNSPKVQERTKKFVQTLKIDVT